MNQKTAKTIHRLERLLTRDQELPQLRKKLKRAWYATPWKERHKLRKLHKPSTVAAWRKVLGLEEKA